MRAASAASIGWIWCLVGCAGDAPRVGLELVDDARPGLELRADVDDPARCTDDADCAGDVSPGPCERATCRADGTCGLVAVADATPCDDADPCTAGDACAGGVCVPGAPDSGAACDDGDACTRDDRCDGGSCVGGAPLTCEDADACTLGACDPAVGCVTVPKSCPDPVGDPCAMGRCEPSTGACAFAPRADGAACDDGLGCTVGATCRDGACVGFVAPFCDDDNVCTVDYCTVEGCAYNPVSGACDDGDPCTTGDTCGGGLCAGAAIVCDDADPCTSDACVGGVCRFDPIAGCVPPSGDCEGKVLGEACDDGDGDTVADLCVADVCRGFTVSRIAPPTGEAWRLTRIDRGRGAWTVAIAIDGAEDDARGALATVTTGGQLTVHGATRGDARYLGLHGGFAVTDAGALWAREAGVWDDGSALAEALDDSGHGEARSLWVHEDDAGVRLWIVGTDDDDPWARRCTTVGLEPLGLEAQCVSQSVLVADSPVLRAITGALSCTAAGCQASLAVAADLFESVGGDGVPRYFNDVYVNSGGVNASWQVAAFDPGPSRMTSNDVAALAPGVFVAAGGYGYLRHNAPSGAWSSPSGLFADQGSLHFEGAWTGDGVVALGAWKELGGGARRLELFVAAEGADLGATVSWHRHPLTTEPAAPSSSADAPGAPRAGLFDVWGDGGVWIAVGAGQPAGGGPLEGLLFVRAP